METNLLDTYAVTRIRPLLPHEAEVNLYSTIFAQNDRKKCHVTECTENFMQVPNIVDKIYKVDQAFGSDDNNEYVYNKIGKSILMDAINGFHCSYLAYGQTGTGKTYTIKGILDNICDNLHNNLKKF